MKARYIRISTTDQNEARQLARHHEDELLFIDKVSGTIPFLERAKASELISEIKKGKITSVATSSVDRLGRNSLDVLNSIQLFFELDVTLIIDNLSMQSHIEGRANTTFMLIVGVLANIAEMERETLRERQLEGIAEAKKKGIYKGRTKGTIETKEQILTKYQDAVRHLKMGKSIRDVAARSEISVGTVQKLRRYLVEIVEVK